MCLTTMERHQFVTVALGPILPGDTLARYVDCTSTSTVAGRASTNFIVFSTTLILLPKDLSP